MLVRSTPTDRPRGADGLLFPNAVDAQRRRPTLIVAESFAARLTAFDVADDGSLGPGRVWGQIAPTPPLTTLDEVIGAVRFAPDGCTLDAEGCIWAADSLHKRCRAHRVGRRDPRGDPRARATTSSSTAACSAATTVARCSCAPHPTGGCRRWREHCRRCCSPPAWRRAGPDCPRRSSPPRARRQAPGSRSSGTASAGSARPRPRRSTRIISSGAIWSLGSRSAACRRTRGRARRT